MGGPHGLHGTQEWKDLSGLPSSCSNYHIRYGYLTEPVAEISIQQSEQSFENQFSFRISNQFRAIR